MTPQEFKAWFEGFTEAFSGTPTKAQWARIKERVADIDGKPVTERVYVDRYWPVYNSPGWRYLTSNTAGGSATNAVHQINEMNRLGNMQVSLTAMGQLGRAEAKAMAG